MFYVLLLIAIGLPLVAPRRYKYAALVAGMLVLFIPWGMQYEMVQDWDMNLERWIMVNVDHDIEFASGRKIEPLYAMLMTLFFPRFGFFMWLMCCALVELAFIFYYMRRFTTPMLYWLVLFALMMNPGYGLLFINSNRQMLSVVFTMFTTLILLRNIDNRRILSFGKTAVWTVLAGVFVYLATKIHSGAYFAYLLLAVYVYVKYRECPKRWVMFLVCNALYFMRFFIEAEDSMLFSVIQLDDLELSTFQHYLTEISDASRSYSVVEQPLYFVIMNTTIYFYNALDKPYRFFAVCSLLGIIGDGFIINTLARILCYFKIYLLFFLPRLVEYVEANKTAHTTIFIRTFYTIYVLYYIFMFYKSQTQSEYYMRWSHFQTILSAPQWL